MTRVRILDQITANKIAAGEVVERPASVVKELVENAIDAGASKIEIEIAGVGVGYLRVTDNGWGMDRDDAVLAFERHATSKIQTPSDLDAIATLGFRGEALPSIGSVSRVEVLTREKNSNLGTKLELSGGKLEKVEDAGCPVGTTIVVRDLFFNTPARRKFLKSEGTETGKVSDLINRLALGFPDVAFKFIINGRVVLHTSGGGKLLEVITSIYGKELARAMLPLKVQRGGISIEGYLAKPEHARSSRSQQSFFLNGRYIKSGILTKAVAEGYHTLVTGNRYPPVVIKLTAPFGAADVNVHPTKLEVRFSDEVLVEKLVGEAVKNCLQSTVLIPGLNNHSPEGFYADGASSREVPTKEIDWISDLRVNQIPATDSLAAKSDVKEYPESSFQNGSSKVEEQRAFPQEISQSFDTLTPEAREKVEQTRLSTLGSAWEGGTELISQDSGAPDVSASKLPELVPLGQIDLTFIAARGPEGLYIIDQHAAHERINFERLWQQAQMGSVQSQLLLEPLTLELTNQEMQLLLENIAEVTDLGFLLEHFGGNTFLLRGKPVNIAGKASQVLRDVIDLFAEGSRDIDPRKLREELIYTIACKSSIRAKENLNQSEMEHLIWQLGKAENPFSCPHGRPTIIAISNTELAKRFQRI